MKRLSLLILLFVSLCQTAVSQLQFAQSTHLTATVMDAFLQSQPAVTCERILALLNNIETISSHSSGEAAVLKIRMNIPLHPIILLLSKNTIDKSWAVTSLGPVEYGNIGKLGISLNQIKHLDTKPTRWIETKAPNKQVEITTVITLIDGRRLTAREPVLIRRDGSPLFR